MSEVDRKLTTILATDVVAFSNMMSRDEPGALHTLKNCLGQIEDCIREHNGRVFGGAGDSLIAEFSSPSSAVKCAVDFQNKIAARNRDCLKQQRMWYRVGINLGDVMIDGDNLYGEGVNIASRLEEVGEPAGVCISHKVYEEVRRNLALTFVDSGKQGLKNIDLPVRVFHLRLDDQDSDASLADYRGKEHRPVPASPKPAGPIHTLALRPISVAGGEKAEFLAEGLRDGLLNSLSRDSEIGLIREQSTVGQDADFVLKGSVRGRADRLRLTFSLIELANGTQVWSERYDRKSGDIFDLEEEISRSVAAAIRVKLKDFEFEWLRNTKDEELSVADLLREGAAFFAHGPGENVKVSASLRAALAREPNNSMAMAMLAFSLHRSFEYSPLVPRLCLTVGATQRIGRMDMNRNYLVIAAVLVVLLFGLTMMRSVEKDAESEEAAPAAETETTTTAD
ncbi:adenylate/guanylate cyclase domain-containing protein [Ruegeria sp. ANG10]|uniref:adenylate/guanylate cyclase domain-containing protein n=1 Tax=Ruegeria sp. ANG10 TaxID=3042467 RepID=UPI003451DD09